MKSGVAGYDPEKYLRMYEGAEGDTPREKINAMRRENYAKHKEEINAQKRAAYKERTEREKDVVLERARISTQNSNKVPLQALDAKGYVDKFDGITCKQEIDKAIYDNAVEMLRHRTGTNYEDLILVDGDSGDVIHKRIASKALFGVDYDAETVKAIENAHKEGRSIIAIHNHPNGLPPSLDDGSSAFVHGYDKGVVVGHNLEVWTYGKTNKRYSSDFCERVHRAIDRKYQLQFSVDFDDELWYDELKKYGMEVNRNG